MGIKKFLKKESEEAEERILVKMYQQFIDEQLTPAYYKRWKMDPVTFCIINKIPFDVGNVIKYVMRFDEKNGRGDLEKAKRYIDLIIEDRYGDKQEDSNT